MPGQVRSGQIRSDQIRSGCARQTLLPKSATLCWLEKGTSESTRYVRTTGKIGVDWWKRQGSKPATPPSPPPFPPTPPVSLIDAAGLRCMVRQAEEEGQQAAVRACCTPMLLCKGAKSYALMRHICTCQYYPLSASCSPAFSFCRSARMYRRCSCCPKLALQMKLSLLSCCFFCSSFAFLVEVEGRAGATNTKPLMMLGLLQGHRLCQPQVWPPPIRRVCPVLCKSCCDCSGSSVSVTPRRSQSRGLLGGWGCKCSSFGACMTTMQAVFVSLLACRCAVQGAPWPTS